MKYLTLLQCLLLTCLSAYSQDELMFDVRYHPQMIYSENTFETTETLTQIVADDEFLKELEEAGIETKTSTNIRSTSEIKTTTGKLRKDKTFPITFLFVDSTESDGSQPIPNGMKISGHVGANNITMLEKITVKGFTKEEKEAMLVMMQSMLNHLVYPKSRMKIGETVTTESPLTIPVYDMIMDFVIITNYKLTDIKNNLGYFDIQQNYVMTSKGDDYDIAAKGTGDGKMTYDIANKFVAESNIDIELDMDFKMEDLDFKFIAKRNQLQKIEVVKKN